MNDTAKSVIRKSQKLKAWEKLLGFFVEKDVRTMCYTIELMLKTKLLTTKEADYLSFEIFTQTPDGPLGRMYMFPTDQKQPRIEFIKNQIELIKNKK